MSFSTLRCTRLLCVPALLLVALAPTTLTAQAGSVTARDAWVREVPAGRAVTGGFMVLENKGTTLRSLIRATATVGDTLELHEMKREDGMMRMSPVKAIEIPAGGSVELRPGGFHMMLFGLKAPLAVGDTVRITLTLDDGTSLKVAAPVRGMQGSAP